MKALLCSSLAGALALVACADTGTAPPGRTVQIATLPLTLPGIAQACFDLRVANAANETVWSKGDPLTSWADGDETICSGQYGSGPGGDISYVGPCDASGPNGVQSNTVTVWVDGLYDAGGDDIADDGQSNWQNPCGAEGCTLAFDCKENQDTAVTFNLTIMRDANQGFFDIAVNFEDIFCSAKFDCTDANDDALQLLFQADGSRGDTVVAAIACTGGPGGDTVLHIDGDVRVTCGGDTIALDPSIAPGNAYTALNPDPDLEDAVWQYAVYTGSEDLDCDGETCAKKFWNIAIGIDQSQADCSVSLFATASDATQMTSGWTASNASYPVIHFDVPVTGPTGGLTCSQHPLNGGDEVKTEYTPFGVPRLFCYHYDGTSVTASSDPGCTSLDLLRFQLGKSEAIGKIAAFETRHSEIAPPRVDIINAGNDLKGLLAQKAQVDVLIARADQQYSVDLANHAKQIDGLDANIANLQNDIASYLDSRVGIQASLDNAAGRLAALGASPIVVEDPQTWVVEGTTYGSYQDANDAYLQLDEQLQNEVASHTAVIAQLDAEILGAQASLQQKQGQLVAALAARNELIASYDEANNGRLDQLATVLGNISAKNDFIAQRQADLGAIVSAATADKVSFQATNLGYIADLGAINQSGGNATSVQLQADFVDLLDAGVTLLDQTIDHATSTEIIVGTCINFECFCFDTASNSVVSEGVACIQSADVIYYYD
ncbi:MAG: hypothetical protein JNJ59_12395 [Deltaproteobacteria bacterium]|nr:hypothetical protein [Deltaproteobacteria bacterium]